MTRSGPAADPRGQNPKPSTAQNRAAAAGPEKVVSPAFKAYGLRHTPEGFEVVEVTVDGPLVTNVKRLRQPEPQRAVANSYLEVEVEKSYWEAR